MPGANGRGNQLAAARERHRKLRQGGPALTRQYPAQTKRRSAASVKNRDVGRAQGLVEFESLKPEFRIQKSESRIRN
jgi:hypothetical protein